uniref:RNA-directed RNA polymerase n=1 Tax=Panagrolaimus sp. ES5 TaxID=591445 RepID=A0AC34GR65_9BILA
MATRDLDNEQDFVNSPNSQYRNLDLTKGQKNFTVSDDSRTKGNDFSTAWQAGIKTSPSEYLNLLTLNNEEKKEKRRSSSSATSSSSSLQVTSNEETSAVQNSDSSVKEEVKRETKKGSKLDKALKGVRQFVTGKIFSSSSSSVEIVPRRKKDQNNEPEDVQTFQKVFDPNCGEMNDDDEAKENEKDKMVLCKLTFRGYAQHDLQKFDEKLFGYSFTNIERLSKGLSSHYEADKNGLGKREESEYSLFLKETSEDLTHLRTSAALAELTYIFDEIQNEMKSTGFERLNENASVIFTISNSNIYPPNFALQNVFPLHRAIFGNLFKEKYFNPVMSVVSEKNSDAIKKFLNEQKGVENFEYAMAAVFENDQESFSIFLNDFFRHCPRVIELKINYSSIRRIVAKVNCREGKFDTVLTFQLSFPPAIFAHRQNTFENAEFQFFARERYHSWDRRNIKEEDISLSSAITLESLEVGANCLLQVFDRLNKLTGKFVQFQILGWNPFIKHQFYEMNLLNNPENLPFQFQKLRDATYFPLVYAVHALISRGGAIYDYFFRKPYACFESFLKLVVQKFDHNLEKEFDKKITRTVRALELMLQKVDDLLDIPEPISFFTSLYDQPEFNFASELTQDLIANGFMRVRKAIVTPTRVLLCNPDVVMGSRSLRMSGGDNMMRITFRDDNSLKLSGVQKVIAGKTVEIRSFSYLCSSNSQMKDHGCYLLAGTQEDVVQFRKECGRFGIEAIPKMMSRLGQCFSQSRQSGIEIARNDYCEIPDFVGGVDGNGNPYIFSDGVGIMSKSFAKQIAEDLGYPNYIPSCVQFRFRGYKGLLVIDSTIDEAGGGHKYQQQHGEDNLHNKKIYFRKSQKKFNGPREKFISIVKVSAPLTVSLNKPLINILDQVSEKQDALTHSKIKSRIFYLLEKDIESIVSCFFDNKNAFLTVMGFPKYIQYQLFEDFHITEEPFFRSMLRSYAFVRLHRLIEKMRIKIPSTHGRTMFGVVDESGILQKGQVFVRYTTNVSLKFPPQCADKTTLVGPVLVTKNPSIVGGDVRIFEAVDIPSMYELVDVIVVPNNGDRPHPNEMSGGDLDGDEFSVFWDSELFVHHNEEPFNYTPAIPELPEDTDDPDFHNKLSDLMIESFKNYISQDSIGTIANSHLVNSDLYGIDSDHCLKIAEKHNQAVDFQKNGIMPEALTKQWSNGEPPEKVQCFPNFMSKTVATTYKSGRILGELHERLNIVKSVLKFEEHLSDKSTIVIDPSFIIRGDDKYYESAAACYNNYSSLIQNLCESYGIPNEGCLFSSNFIALKKRLVDRDEDNTSVFTTQYMIEEQLANIFEKIRLEFFEEFGGLEKYTVIDDMKNLGIRQAFSRICNTPTTELRKKASAYYRVAYDQKKYLSFAWSVGDILMANRKSYCFINRQMKLQSLFPLEDKLSTIIDDAAVKFAKEYDIFVQNLDETILRRESNIIVSLPCAQICHHNQGLRKLLFFVRKWSAQQNLSEISPKIFDALVILFGSGRHTVSCEPIITIPQRRGGPVDDLESRSGGLGKIFLNFIQCLLTQKFISSEVFSLLPFSKRVLQKSQCLMIYYKAMETFYPIAVNRTFGTLPGVKENERNFDGNNVEAEVFVIEIPMEVENYEELLKLLGEKCGCKYITIKRKPENKIGKTTFRVALQAVGSFWAAWRFRQILLPTANMNEPSFEQRFALLRAEAYNRLQFYTNEEHSIDDIYPF